MTEAEMEEIIALCESGEVDFSGVWGRPPTPESEQMVAAMADSLFFQLSFDEQVSAISSLPPQVSARTLAHMPASDRAELLVHVPQEVADWILALVDGEAVNVL